MTLPISNIINVTLQGTPSGLVERNVNSIALFTNETPDNLDDYGIYITPQQVIDDYGSTSVTAQMANNIFAQTPNIRSGNGRLVVVPMQSAVSATAGNFVTSSLAVNLDNILEVTDGFIKVTLNGTDIDLTGLTFAGASDLADVATILQKKLPNIIITSTETALTFTSKKVGADSSVDLATIAGGTGTDLSGAGYFNASGGTSTDGEDSSGEALLDAITRIEGDVSFVGVMTNLDLEDDAIETIASGIQAKDMIFVHHFASTEDIAGIATTISSAGQFKTRCLLYTNSLVEANLMKSAYVGRAFSVNFRGSNTAQTMNLKQLANVTPDSGITQTNYINAETAGIDLFVSYQGVPCVFSTGGNIFFDNVYNDLALKFALEANGFNYLRQTNTKVPQTEADMNGLKNAYAQVCDRFVKSGSIGVGLIWQSSETFGDPETFKNNITSKGYYVYSLPIAQQDSIERGQRKAPLVQIAVKRAGAIHTSDVIVVVND